MAGPEDVAGLRDAVSRCLSTSAGPRPYLLGEAGTDEPYDTKLWRSLAVDIGVAGLMIDARCGGTGAGVAAAAVVAEELGRALAPVPFLSSVGLATSALVCCAEGAPVAAELLTRLATGRTSATLAFGSDTTGELDDTGVAAAADADGWRLTGRRRFVVDGGTADTVLVVARADGQAALFAVASGDAGVTRTVPSSLDLTRGLATVDLTAAPARLIAAGAQIRSQLTAALDLARALMSAEQVGAAGSCLDRAVEYAKTRTQFGRPIGSFQAIKHTLATVLLRTELARSVSDAAVAAADRYLAEPGPDAAADLAEAASLANALCSDSLMFAAEESLHVHGGIGFTWEHDAHLYYRRAIATRLLLGDPDQERDRLAGAAGLDLTPGS